MRKEEHELFEEIAHNVARYMDEEYMPPEEYDWNDVLRITNKLHSDFKKIYNDESEANIDMLYEHGFSYIISQDDPKQMLYAINGAIKSIKKQMGRVSSGTLYRLTLENLYDFKELKEAFHGGQMIDIRPNTLVWMDGTVVWCIRDISDAHATDYNKGQEFSAEMNGDTYYAGSIDEIIIKLYAECGDTVSKVKMNTHL